MADKKEALTVKAPVMYIGPNLLKYGLRQNAVYKDGIPDIAADLLAAKPVAKQLFVDIDGIAEAKNQALQKGTAIYTAYQEVGRK